MAAKWADAALQVVAFDEAAEGEAGASSPAFVAYAVHAFSLLHATALHSLRGDSVEGALVPAPLHHPRAQVGWLFPATSWLFIPHHASWLVTPPGAFMPVPLLPLEPPLRSGSSNGVAVGLGPRSSPRPNPSSNLTITLTLALT